MVSGRARSLQVLIIVVVVGLVCASSLSVKLSSASTSLAAEKAVERGGIRFTMSLEKTVFGVGELINATFTIMNVSNQTIACVTGSTLKFSLEVYDESNQRIYLSSQTAGMAVWVIRLSPGENFACALDWPQICNENVTDPWGVPVPPGRYFFVGYFFDNGLGVFKTAPLEVDILSPTQVAFTIGIAVVAPVMLLLAVVLLARKR